MLEVPPGTRSSEMKTIVAVLTVKDEVELLERSISHLRAVGVEQIVAFDAGSTDGSLQILEQHHDPPRFHLLHQPDLDPDAEAWGRRSVEAARASGADWAIFLDADEFWIPASGRLSDSLALASADAVRVPRFNVPLTSDGPRLPRDLGPEHLDELLLICQPIPEFRRHLEEHPETPWIRGVPVPKLMVRPERAERLDEGAHGFVPRDGRPLRRLEATEVLIAHVPFTDLRRFSRKVANVRRVFSVHDAYFGTRLAWHWRRWLALESDEAIAAEFQRQSFDPETLAQLRAAGVVKSAAELLAPRVAGA